MAVQLSVTFEDLGLAAVFDHVAAGAEDMTDLMDSIGSVLINGAQERLGTTNVGPDGTAWPKSLRATLVGGPTLHDTGRLLRSITSEAAPDQVRVGSNLIYAGVHQAGAVIRPKNGKALFFTLANGDAALVGSVTIPARPYLGISEEDRATIEDVTLVHFEALLEGAP